MALHWFSALAPLKGLRFGTPDVDGFGLKVGFELFVLRLQL